MSITFSLAVQQRAVAKPAIITARQLAAFRAFARERGELIEDDDDDPLVSASFEARVCPWSLASICALFDHDEAVIAVVEEAQFRGLTIRFWRDDATRSIRMCVGSSPDGAADIDNAGYFNGASRMVRVGDFIMVNAGVDGVPSYGVMVVASNANGSVDVTNLTSFGAFNTD